MASVMDKATFSQLCRLMDAGDDTVRKFVRGMLKIGLMSAVGLVGAGMADVLGEGVAWLTDAFSAAADDSDAPDRSAGTIVDFFKDKTSYSSLEKALIAHVLMVFSAYFDTLEANAPDACKFVALQDAEKEYLVRYAQTQRWDKDLAEADLFMPTIDADLPKTYTGLVGFYTAMTEKLRIFMEGYMETLPGHKKDRLIGLLNRLPWLALNTYHDQLIKLSAKSNDFLVYQIFGGFADLRDDHGKIMAMLKAILAQLRPPAPEKPRKLVLSGPSTNGFVGRETELAQIGQRLMAQKPVVLSGLGGIGKSVLAAKFCQDYEGGDTYFITFSGSFQSTISGSIGTALPHMEKEADEQKRFAAAMAFLAQRSERDILVIDNVDDDEKDFFQLLEEAFYGELLKLPLRLILTTRTAADRSIEVEPMENKVLYEIFHNHGVRNHGVRIPNEQMDALIKAVDRHTMAVDIIARTLVHNRALTPDKLLQQLKDGSVVTQNYRPVGSDRDQQQLRIYGHMTRLFRVAALTEEEQTILRWAVLLGQDGMDFSLFCDALPEELRQLPDALADRGWLSCKKGNRITLHPIIRLVCREELKPDDDNCKKFLNALWRQYSSKKYNADRYRQLAETFTTATQILPDAEGGCAVKAGFLWKQLEQAAQALPLEQQAVSKLESAKPDSKELATAYNNLGATYGKLGDHKKALKYGLKALELQKKALPEDHPHLVASYNNVGGTYGNLGDHKKALEFKLKALKIREKALPEDHPNLALSYNNVGGTYADLGDHPKALEHLLKALEIRKKALPEDHPDIASSYNNVGFTYGELGDHHKALEYGLKALKIQEKALPEDHPDLALSYNNVGSTYGDLGDHPKALELKLKALEIREKALPKDHPDLALSYNNVGITYGNLGDHETELDYQLKALEIWEKVLPEDHPHIATSYSNVGITYGDLGDHPKALESKLKALKIREKVLPEDHPDLAGSCYNVGYTYFAMDDYETALPYLQRAADIAQRSLPEGHPHRQRYQRNLAYLKQYISEQEHP